MKKLLSIFLLISCFAINYGYSQIPEDATIDPSQIEYWVGEGSNEAVVIISWCSNTETALAWGYRFDGEANLLGVLNAIAAEDSRLTIIGSAPSNITYQDDVYDLTMCTNPNAEWGDDDYDIPMFGFNGVMGQVSFSAQSIVNGDIVKVGGYACAFMSDDWTGISWTTPVVPASDPNGGTFPEDVSIHADSVIYWVGNGEHKVVLAVNWCDPATAFAWGVRFDNDSALVSDLMNTIKIYDERFDYEVGDWGINDIMFNDATHSMQVTPASYWMYNVNGTLAPLGYNDFYAHDGDFIKWGDATCAAIDTSNWNYAWTTEIAPVALPADTLRSFDGVVGTQGCQAIYFENDAIIGWATNCVVNRGPQDIADGSLLASYGDESAGIGPSSLSTMDAVSLGDGGEAILTFDAPISDEEGYDFAVFENALNNTFLELAFVEVSSDGEHYYRFPSVSSTQLTTQVTNGGEVDATGLYNLAGKYQVGYGTPFDLAELAGYSDLDLDNITHVKLVDVVGSINPEYGTTDRNGRIINDPYPTNFNTGGYDLTGVAVLNGWTPDDVSINNYTSNNTLNVYPNPCQSVIYVDAEQGEMIALYNAEGMMVSQKVADSEHVSFNMQSYASGIYFVKSGSQTVKVVKL